MGNYFTTSRRRLRTGQYQLALEKFTKALESDPQNIKFLLKIGRVYFKLLKNSKEESTDLAIYYTEALKYLNQALEIDEYYIPAIAERGFVYNANKEDGLAEIDFQKVISRSKENNPNWNDEDWKATNGVFFILGQKLSGQEKYKLLTTEYYDQALSSIERAIKLNPDYYEFWMCKASLLGKLQRFSEAFEDYKKAILLNPQSSEILWYQANTLRLCKRFEEALNSYDSALEINPDRQDVYHDRLRLIQKSIQKKKVEHFPAICKSWERVSLLKPDNSEWLYYYGNSLRATKKLEKALEIYNRAVKINPNDLFTWIAIGEIQESQAHYEKAIESYRRAIDINPLHDKNYKAYYHSGELFIKLAKWEEALDCYENAIKLNPTNRIHKQDCWYQKGKMLNFLQRPKEALDAYQRTLDFNCKHIYAWNEKGNTLAKIKNYDAAIEAFRQALEISENKYWRAWKNIGWLYLNSNKGYQRAIDEWKEGLKHLSSDDLEGRGTLHHTIGKVYYSEGLKRLGGDGKHWKNAEESYNNALSYLENAPNLVRQYLEVLEDMYILYLSLKKVENAEETQRLQKAKEIQRIGKDTLDRLLDKNTSLDEKKKLALQFSTFDQLTVNQQIQSGEVISALETAEKGKNACLTWILSGWTKEPKTSTWTEMQGLIPDVQTAIVYWHLSPVAITTFVLKRNYDRPILVGASEEIYQSIEKVKRFEVWVKKWNQLYNPHESNNDRLDWRKELPDLMEELDKNILDIKAILPEIEGVRRLILIPHRDLHRFPVHALFPRHLTISYLPSIYLGLQSKERPFSFKGKLLIVENPRNDLQYSETECSSINQMLSDLSPTIEAREAATKDSILHQLKSPHTFFHFSGHGKYEPSQPEQSALFLWNSEKLTVKEILKLKFNQYHLVTLSACETAVTDKQSITEEYVGLVSAFLYQKVGYIVSTLWIVTDESSCIMMVYFYWQLKKGKQPAEALARASRFLRGLTNARLKIVYEAILTKLPKSQKQPRPFLRRKLSEIEKMNSTDLKRRPFKHPYHWSSFTITGK